jgi:hypothetical protein
MKEDILSVSELRTILEVKFSKFEMVSLKRVVSNGKISLEFVLTALPI